MLQRSVHIAKSSHADIMNPDLNKACRALTGCLEPSYVYHSMFGHIPSRSRLKSKNDFLMSVKQSYFLPKVVRCNECQKRSGDKSGVRMIGLEKTVKGYDRTWLTWRCLNRLGTGYTCSKEYRKKCCYFNGDISCA